jgi:hypothetical protein
MALLRHEDGGREEDERKDWPEEREGETGQGMESGRIPTVLTASNI